MKEPALSDEQLAGQLLMAGFHGTELNSGLKFFIDTLHIGGVILFSRNVESPGQLRRLCRSIQDYATGKTGSPLLIAIDQEGGRVARLRAPFTEFPGNPSMRGIEDVKRFVEITSRELKTAGVNMNLVPVLDVAPGGIDSVMAERAFGADPAWASKMGSEMIRGYQDRGVIPCAKHFPGIGRTSLDSHEVTPFSDLSLEELENFELVPFKSAIAQNVDSIMLSHVVYRKIDPDWPASLSVAVSSGLLRKRLGFQGVILTDDIEMGAIKKRFDMNVVVHQFLISEADIMLVCHDRSLVESVFGDIVKAAKDDPGIKEKMAASVNRIRRLKKIPPALFV